MSKKEYALLSELAREFNLNKSHLRLYERRGLIEASFVVGPQKVRMYDKQTTLGRIKQILKLRDKGLSIDEILKGKHEAANPGKK